MAWPWWRDIGAVNGLGAAIALVGGLQRDSAGWHNGPGVDAWIVNGRLDLAVEAACRLAHAGRLRIRTQARSMPATAECAWMDSKFSTSTT